MQWRVRKNGAKYRALHKWHKWFAWYPVRIPTQGNLAQMTKVWMENIERKGIFHDIPYDIGWWKWEYRWENKQGGN